MSSLGYELPKEMARVRDELLPRYDNLPFDDGVLTAKVMRHELDVATRALAEGDVIQMMRSYEQLKKFEAI